MLNPKEIRIGNIFNVDGGQMLRMRVERFFVDERDRDSAVIGSTREFLQHRHTCPLQMLEGVPLTEEIIQELGFTWDMVTATYTLDGIDIIDNGEQGYFALLTPQDYNLTLPVKYLHTLQNIYFYLKGKELPIPVAHFDEEEQ